MKAFAYCLILLCCYSGLNQARTFDDDDAELLDDFTFLPKAPWQEGEVVLPAYPKDKNLLELLLDRRASALRYFIDLASLSVGKDDVVRYSMVIRSATGATNVSYEGMRCDVQRYQAYAFATTSSAQFRKARRSSWRRISKLRVAGYRYALYQHFLCRAELPVAVPQIIAALRYDQEQWDDADDVDPFD